VQRVVPAIGISVKILRKTAVGYIFVGTEETRNDGVVEAAVHVDNLEVRIVLVAGKTAGGKGKVYGRRRYQSIVGRKPNASAGFNYGQIISPGVKIIALPYLFVLICYSTITA
jgi:hypothetical protein